MDIESFWEYDDPSASEDRFREALISAKGDGRLELMTQLARTYSLRRRFEEAHQLLDQVETELATAGARPQARYQLERGRAYNSNGQTTIAQGHFLRAWEIAQAAGEDGLAVDAAHMLAICSSGQPAAFEWSSRGLSVARRSQDSKARSLIPAMLNNAAWDFHDQGRYPEALSLFEEALVEWESTGKTSQTRIARWAVARCLRSLDRYEQALSIQLDLEAVHLEDGTSDGFVYEEIAENMWAMGRFNEARPYFTKAFNELKRDEWLANNEVERLNQLEARARQVSGD